MLIWASTLLLYTIIYKNKHYPRWDLVYMYRHGDDLKKLS